MTETATLLQDLQSALANDAEFVAWCITTFDATPVIQIDVHDLEQVDDTDFPFVGLFDIVQVEGLTSPHKEWNLRVMAGVRNTELAATTVNTCKLKTYTGRLESENLREAIAAALFRGGLGAQLKIEGFHIERSFHPKYYSGFNLTVEKVRI